MASVDVTQALVLFARQLRAAGLGVSLSQVEGLLRAFEWLDPCSRSDVYNAARTTLLTRREDLALFDRSLCALLARRWPPFERRS